ncbi:MAG: ACT domain-containing protein [Rhizobacter sp.]|nr:ACT domain-containing protein [Chlorobiales bacterium]
MKLSILPEPFAVSVAASGAAIPAWAMQGGFMSVTRTPDELSIVCAEKFVPPDAVCERDWRALKVEGILDFALTGVMAALTVPLAEAKISVSVLSTFNTDYVLVKSEKLADTVQTLRRNGYDILEP